jgi:hypothetical protein
VFAGDPEDEQGHHVAHEVPSSTRPCLPTESSPEYLVTSLPSRRHASPSKPPIGIRRPPPWQRT